MVANGLQVNESQIDRLNEYHNLLLSWNARINLISRKDQSNIWPNHIVHSISPLFMMTIPDGIAIADIGSGGGLPGIPLAIALPTVKIMMVESIRKKAEALKDMISRLGLSNAMVVNSRAEELGKSKLYRSSVDMIIARAVAPLKSLVEWALPLLRRTSNDEIEIKTNTIKESHHLPVIVALKGGEIDSEIAEAQKLQMTQTIRSFDIRFDGIDKTGLFDKKLVMVGLIRAK